MILNIQVPSDLDPAHPDVIAAAHNAASQRATAWTDPVHTDTRTVDGRQIHYFQTDAVPRPAGIVTTANVAPVLLPAKVIR